MVKIAVNGAAGRMGSRILALAKASQDLEVAGSFDAGGPVKLSAEALKGKGKGVLIDFSSPQGALAAAEAASQAGWALVVGTTGLEEIQSDALKKAARSIPVVVSSNMSIGVNVVLALLEMVSKKLPKDFTVEMSEAHHIHKKDAPSGTALMLARQIAASRPLDFAALSKSIRVIREGEIVGDHSVTFAGSEETIEIKHHAVSRDIFAQGALTAARFVSKKTAGLYSMRDVLGL
jgi:4-hydroxy-tetrahydrodipicolinate reductase